MRRYALIVFVLRRLVTSLLIAVLLGSITFVVARMLPGSPVALLAGPNPTPKVLHKITADLGLDKPIPVQYVSYLADLSQLDFGSSLQTGNPVSEDLASRFPATLELVLVALGLGTIGGIGLGVYTATRDRGLGVSTARTVGLLGAAIPEFWLGLVLISIFYVNLGWSAEPFGRISPGVGPPTGITGFYTIDSVLTGNVTAFGDAVSHLAMPASVLAMVALAPISRVTRAAMRDALNEDFVLAARANGDAGFRLFVRRVLPVASAPVLTVVALASGVLLGGDALVELVFSWPGLGQYGVEAVRLGDFNALQGVVLVAGLMYVLIFMLADIASAVLDPRTGALRS